MIENERRLSLYFKPVTIAPESLSSVEATPEINFLGEQMFSDDRNLSGLSLEGLWIGTKEQYTRSLPLEAYNRGLDIVMGKCKAGELITIQVKNNSDKDKLFACTMIGKRWV